MKEILKIFLLLIFVIVFIIPGYTFFLVNPEPVQTLFSTSGFSSARIYILFRFFGLYAFTLIWAQLVIGPFMSPLARIFGAQIIRWHRIQGVFALVFATIHPLLFYTAFLLGSSSASLFSALPNYLGEGLLIYGLMGIIAWTLMVTTVITALLRNRPWMVKYWHYIHLLNYLVFILVFVHSYNIGSDVRLQPLQTLYTFFAITFTASLVYRVGYRRIYINWIKSLFAS